jgi:periplasmic protein TonB
MRWFMVPVSICAHVLLAAAIVIVPLAADDEWPRPAPLQSLVVITKVAPVPASVFPPAVRRPAPPVNVTAPSMIGPERDTPVEPAGPPGPGALTELTGPVGDGVPDGLGVRSTAPVPPPAPPAPPPTIAPLRVGGAVREPKRITDVRPVYPAIAQAAKVEGLVILEAVINERGVVERVKVLRSVPLLDAAAVDAVQKWRYTPTLLNGTPVSVLMTITLRFTLHD